MDRKKTMHLLFIQTGGTIDKDYPHTTKGWAFEFGEPAVPRILEKVNPSFNFSVVTAFQKDSLEITDQDRAQLADIIIEHGLQKNIITHGTDTLVETAAFLADKIKDQLIILTGAMRPERFYNSDAVVNLGVAIGGANVLDSGVWISMHGILKPYDEVQRNLKTGQFY
jgi:L-asparaginase